MATKGSLTPEERETVITTCDADDHWCVHTTQQKIMTKMRKAGAKLIDEGAIGATKWARYEIPFNMITFRTKTRAGVKRTSEDKAKAE